MPNVDAPNGFLPVGTIGGSGQTKVGYHLLSSTNSAIGAGTPVKYASGVVDVASAGDALVGIAAESKAANSGGYIAVWDSPFQLFEAQTDDGTGTLTSAAGVGLNANFVAGSVSNGRSTSEIDESTGATTATLPFKVLDIGKGVSNAYGEFNRLIVKINNHQLGSHTGTAGT